MKVIKYKPSVQKGSNHYLEIDGEAITTTIAKEVLHFAKYRIRSKSDWRELKKAVRLGVSLDIQGAN